MIVQELSIKNFRNIASLTLTPHRAINLFVGDNGQGKSNILEALGLLASGRSFRTAHDGELIAWDSPFSRLDTILSIEGEETLLSLVLMREGAQGAKKKMTLSGAPVKKLSQFIGRIKAVIFSRHDLEIISGGPDGRRRFLDHLLSCLSTRYLLSLQRYMTIVKERNNWLRHPRGTHATSLDDVLREQLARQGSSILQERTFIIDELAAQASHFYHLVTAHKGTITLTYAPSFTFPPGSAPFDYFMRALESRKSLEMMRKMTLVGPHRDDVCIFLDGKPLRLYGSQGEQRCAALALKLAERLLIKEKTEHTPLLILDDSFSELDRVHKESLWQAIIPEGQSFVSSNFIPVEGYCKSPCAIYRVTDGKVTPYV
jgi:DNA replication and repair protein RecF